MLIYYESSSYSLVQAYEELFSINAIIQICLLMHNAFVVPHFSNLTVWYFTLVTLMLFGQIFKWEGSGKENGLSYVLLGLGGEVICF